jgi:hypothetical protein
LEVSSQTAFLSIKEQNIYFYQKRNTTHLFKSLIGGIKDVRLRCRCCTQRSTQATAF